MERVVDEPWRRLPAELAIAAAVLGVCFYGFAVMLQHPAIPPAPPKPLDAKIVVIPTPPPPPVKHQNPKRPRPDPRRPKPKPIVKQKAQPAPKPVLTHELDKIPVATTSAPVVVMQSAPPTPQPSQLPGGGSMGAHAIYQPAPQIPDDLREEIINTVAVARFHVAKDGTTKVALIQPTPNVRLNQVILEALKEWKFFPAMTDGQPQDSTMDIRIPIQVN